MQETTHTLFSWNVNGIRAAEKKGFVDILLDFSPAVAGIQEIKARPDQLSQSLLAIPGYSAYWFPAVKPGYSGVATYSRIRPCQVVYGIDCPEFDQEGRVLTLEFEDYYFVNAYFPNAQHGLKRIDYKIAFNKALHGFLDRLTEKKSVVLGGDYNIAHRPLDLANPEANTNNPGYSAEERRWMDHFLSNGYVDTFRMFNQEPHHYTWWSYRFRARERNIGWRIDYFCVDAASETRVKNARILDHVPGSDHCPVTVEFQCGRTVPISPSFAAR